MTQSYNKKNKEKEKTPPYILEVCILIERKKDF